MQKGSVDLAIVWLRNSEVWYLASTFSVVTQCSMNSPGYAQKAQIWPISLNQSDTERRKISIPWPKSDQFWKWSGCISIQNFRLFPLYILREMPRNHKIWPLSLSKNSAKRRKINRLSLWTNQYWRWSGYISMQNFRPFHPCILQEMPGNHKFDPFH